MPIKAVREVRDILPAESPRWQLSRSTEKGLLSFLCSQVE